VRTPKPNRRNTIAGIVIGTVAALTAVGMVLSERGVFELRPSAGLQQIEDELRAQQSATAAKPAATAPTPAAAANPEPAASPSSNAGSDAATNPTSDAASNPIVTPPVNAPAFGPTAAVSTTPTREDSAPAPPVVPPSATVAASAPGGDVALIESLVLTVTARDTCTLRLQIDSDARHAQRYAFTQVGETRSWSAKQSFRVVARTGSSLDMWLNGMPVRIPTDGRTIVFDRATLRGDTTPVVAPPKKVRRTSRRKSRPAQTTRPAPAPAVPDPVPQNAAGPP